eukprot:GHVN01075735.1.p1 GENE.GHVN01075735.1~~GHVN01075735.1.p1  ORF type:complete len:626 (-),score=277.54 GHVN01075735.1:72-1748(-)
MPVEQRKATPNDKQHPCKSLHSPHSPHSTHSPHPPHSPPDVPHLINCCDPVERRKKGYLLVPQLPPDHLTHSDETNWDVRWEITWAADCLQARSKENQDGWFAACALHSDLTESHLHSDLNDAATHNKLPQRIDANNSTDSTHLTGPRVTQASNMNRSATSMGSEGGKCEGQTGLPPLSPNSLNAIPQSPQSPHSPHSTTPSLKWGCWLHEQQQLQHALSQLHLNHTASQTQHHNQMTQSAHLNHQRVPFSPSRITRLSSRALTSLTQPQLTSLPQPTSLKAIQSQQSNTSLTSINNNQVSTSHPPHPSTKCALFNGILSQFRKLGASPSSPNEDKIMRSESNIVTGRGDTCMRSSSPSSIQTLRTTHSPHSSLVIGARCCPHHSTGSRHGAQRSGQSPSNRTSRQSPPSIDGSHRGQHTSLIHNKFHIAPNPLSILFGITPTPTAKLCQNNEGEFYLHELKTSGSSQAMQMNDLNHVWTIGVLDGHGVGGKTAAHLMADCLASAVANARSLSSHCPHLAHLTHLIHSRSAPLTSQPSLGPSLTSLPTPTLSSRHHSS